MNHRLQLVLLFLCLSCWGYGSPIIEVNSSTHGYIGQQVDYFVDETNALDFQEIVALQEQGLFLNSTSQIIVHTSPLPMYWFSFQLRSQLAEAVWLNINNSNLNEVELYRTNLKGEIIDHYHTGSAFPKNTRAFDCHTFWFPLVEEGDTSTYRYYIRLKASLNMLAPLEVGTLEQLKDSQHQSDFFVIFFLGAMCVMFLYNLVLFLFTQDRVYGYYSFYIIATTFTITFLNNTPIIIYLIGSNLTYNYTACWLWTSLISMGMFTIHYLQLPTFYPKINKIIWVEMACIMVYGVLNFFIPAEYLSFSYQILVLVFFITCILTAYYVTWKSKSNRAILYSVGWTVMILGATSHLLVINGILDYSPITRNLQYLGVFIEILIFSISLARSLNELKAKQENLNAVLKVTNESLAQSNDSLDSFNYHVSHDLKTVLNNSNALARMISKYNKLGNQEKVQEIVEKLHVVTKNGTETVQSFLSLGQIDSLLKDVNIGTIILESAVQNIIESHDLKDKINVIIEQNTLVSFQMHQKAFESIFLNFFTNTIKYNNTYPVALISFVETPAHSIFSYQDNGIGIDKDHLREHLFKAFHRGAGNEKKEGSGMGLYLVKRIVNNYNGTITATSELGKGLAFEIKFPKN